MQRFFHLLFVAVSLLAAPILVLGGPYDVPYRIPDTGQTKCYDVPGNEIPCAGTGQDGAYSINPMSYTKLDVNGNELDDSAGSWAMVRDNVTGLIWEVKTDDGGLRDKDNRYSWNQANNYCEALELGGYSDWRLPSREELRSIVDYGRTNPAANTNFFPKTVSSYYWSSTTSAPNGHSAWYINFYDGNGSNDSKSYSRYVRAVLGGQGGSFGSWIIHGNNTATHEATGLMWQTNEAGSMHWQEALAYCENLVLDGHDDWRLPTIKELASISKLDTYDPAAEETVFPNIVSSNYWSSTTLASYEDYAWYVGFYYGYDYSHDGKSGSRYVRAVLGGQGGSFDHLTLSASPTPTGPIPLPVDFTATPSNAQIKQYQWEVYYADEFQGVFETQDGNIQMTFEEEGDFTVTVIAEDFNGEQYEKSIQINALAPVYVNNDIQFSPYYPQSDAVPSQVMRGGSAVRHYRVLDENGDPLADREIYYTFDQMANGPFQANIDANGFVRIKTPFASESNSYKVILTDRWGDPVDFQVENAPQFNVELRDRELREEHAILIGLGLSGSFGLKSGSKTGAKLGFSGGQNISTVLELHTIGDRTDLIMKNLKGDELGAEATVGFCDKTWNTIFRPKAEVSLGAADFEVKNIIGTDHVFPDFLNESKPDHARQLAVCNALFVENALKGVQLLFAGNMKMAADFVIGKTFDWLYEQIDAGAYELGVNYTLGARGSLGSGESSITLKNPLRLKQTAGTELKFTFKPIEGEWLYENVTDRYTNGLLKRTQTKIGKLDFGRIAATLSNKLGDGRKNKTPTLRLTDLNMSACLGELVNLDCPVGRESISMINGNGLEILEFSHLVNRNAFTDNFTEDLITTYTIDNRAAMEAAAKNSKLIRQMRDDNPFDFELGHFPYQHAYEAIIGVGDGEVAYEKTVKETEIGDFNFELAFAIGINAQFKKESALEYAVERGVILPTMGYLETELYEKDDYIADNVKGVDAVLSTYKQLVEDIVAEFSNYAEEQVERGVDMIIDTGQKVYDGGAKLVGKAGDLGENLVVGIRDFVTGGRSARVLTARNGETGTALTVGNLFIVTATDPTGTQIEQFPNPVQLTIGYADAMLTAAGLSAEDALKLSMYRWDATAGHYAYVGGEVDAQAHGVTADILLPGQYLLAIDEAAPQVFDFKTSDSTPLPVISFNINDAISGVNAETFSVKLDGEEKISGDNYEDYVDVGTGTFKWAVETPLSEGSHALDVSIGDTTGNVEEYGFSFAVNAAPPEIDHQPVESAVAGSPVDITANATDDENIARVFLYSRPKTDETPYLVQEMTPAAGAEYVGTIPSEFITSFGARYFVRAVDVSGNVAEITPVDIAVQDAVGPDVPHDIEIQQAKEGIQISWTASPDADTAGYRVYIGQNPGALTLLEDVGDMTWTVVDESYRGYYAGVSAYDATSQEGEKAVSAKLDPCRPGDVNCNAKIELDDAIFALRIVTNIDNAQEIIKIADVGGNGRIGLEEVIYVLQHIAARRK